MLLSVVTVAVACPRHNPHKHAYTRTRTHITHRCAACFSLSLQSLAEAEAERSELGSKVAELREELASLRSGALGWGGGVGDGFGGGFGFGGGGGGDQTNIAHYSFQCFAGWDVARLSPTGCGTNWTASGPVR